MDLIQAVILGVVEGITEFLPISSTGHLTIVEKMMGFKIDDPGVTAFTAIIQIGAVLATLVYFRKDIWDIVAAWVRGLFNAKAREDQNYRFGWAVIVGTLPIMFVGYALKDQIQTGFRSLWYVGFALLLWSGVMYAIDQTAKLNRHRESTNWKDTLFIGIVQCLALIPGVSRSGATMSAGLFRGFDRVTVTKLSFFLSIPALLAAGAYESVTKYKDISDGVGWAPTIVATIVSFFVAYAAVAWLLRYIAHHNLTIFVVYRIVLGLLIIGLLSFGVVSAT